MTPKTYDIDMYIDFINENLFSHFIRKSYSVSGIKGALDVSGAKYSTYAHCIGSLSLIGSSENGVTSLYSNIESLVSKTINGLIKAKSNQKPEGAEVGVRKVDVHWREYPNVKHIAGTVARSEHIILTYRVSTIQKEEV